ncbi:MAG: glutamate-5-semialdehyde dehydrogenase, partial [Lachnospiraceae bacterium]|nr:glutamate-5-semialdehyde dehydrogenase [Lachnospiraceae bacterium]
IRQSLAASGVPEDAVILVGKTDRETATEMMRANRYKDVLIPRGGAGLISSVVQNSTVPVIETGTGNCHVFVDESADLEMALDIIDNAKTQRLGVCNACESLVIHRKIAARFRPMLYERLTAKQIVFRADECARGICPEMEAASEEDFYKEYLDRLISVKTVDSVDEAIEHINEHNTKHSESIVTADYDNAMKFLDLVDAAAVYVNASTRFTDGGEFGMGAEIGISTQKLHARGPMGMKALTTTKYVIFGNGQVRP